MYSGLIGNNKNIKIKSFIDNRSNSGVWQDMKIEVQEDQQKFIIPINRDTEKIFYNQRMIIDSGVLSEPRCWRVTKVNRINPNGLCLITLAQDKFDQNRDYIELNSDGNVVGMWADYYQTTVDPIMPEPIPASAYLEISYSGSTPSMRIGGSAKKFTVHYYENSEETDVPNGDWSFAIDGEDVSDLITQTISGSSNKIKFNGDDSYIGHNLSIKYASDELEDEVLVPLIAL